MAKRYLSVQLRIAAVVLLVLTIGVAASIVLTTTEQRRNLLDAARNTLAVNTEMLNITIRNIMLSGEAPLANRTMEDLRSIASFREFELYRIDGTTAFNDAETLDFVNMYQDRMMFDETPRSPRRVIDDAAFDEVLRSNSPLSMMDEEAREMEYFFPILNYAECRECHGDEPFVRGVSHFRISLDGVYGQVRRAGFTLTGFLAGVGVLLFVGILALLRRLIVRPVLSIGSTAQAVTDGNLDARTDVVSRDELGDLAGRINTMISGLRERADLEVRARVSETRLEESRKYLDNIREGLLLVDPDYRITEQYSAYLSDLFEREDLAGSAFVDLVSSSGPEHETLRKDIDDFLHILFTNVTADMAMILDINPLDEVTLVTGRGREIIVKAGFQRIFEGPSVVNVMVIFEDITDIAKTREELASERKQRESELERIAAILKVGPAVYEGFINEAGITFDSLTENLGALEDSESVSRSFREIHSVKGTARYLGFSRIEELAHTLEDILDALRKSGGSLDQAKREAIDLTLSQLGKEVDAAGRLIDRFREFAVPGDAAVQSPLRVFEERVRVMVEEIAAELEKQVSFTMESSLDRDEIPELSDLQPSLFHIIRNALDHGIEDPFERLSAQKGENARIALRFREDAGRLFCEVEDDGRGIDLDELETVGVETGLLKPGKHLPSQVIMLLFRPGFSGKGEVTRLSGRGVGLDAVRDDMKRLGGQINVRTAKGKGTRFTLSLPRQGGRSS